MKKNWMGMKFVVNKFDSRQSIDQDYWASYKENFPKYFTSEKIRSAAAIKKASAARMSIFEYSAKEGVVADYQKVLNELSVFTEKSFDEYQKAKNEHEKRSKERKKKKSDQQESI
jgi:cellulose biosynthesis protein BcsQ